MNEWEKFNETSLPEKKKIFTVALIWKILLMQIVCTQKRVFKGFEI